MYLARLGRHGKATQAISPDKASRHGKAGNFSRLDVKADNFSDLGYLGRHIISRFGKASIVMTAFMTWFFCKFIQYSIPRVQSYTGSLTLHVLRHESVPDEIISSPDHTAPVAPSACAFLICKLRIGLATLYTSTFVSKLDERQYCPSAEKTNELIREVWNTHCVITALLVSS